MDGIQKSKFQNELDTQENTEVLCLLQQKHEIRPGSQHLFKKYLDLLSNDLEMGNYAPRLEVKHDWVKEQLDSCTFKFSEKFCSLQTGDHLWSI